MKDQITTHADSQVAKAINDLNAGWRNVVAKALGVDSNTFQMAQGNLGLQSTDSSGLFLMADAVPPLSTTAYYDPSGKNTRSSAYSQLLLAMKPTTTSGLASILKDKYARWINYLNADTSDLSMKDLFAKWADRNLEPMQKTAAFVEFERSLMDPLYVAVTNYRDKANYTEFADSSDQLYSLPKYSCTIDAAQAAINSGASAQINYDSSTADTSSHGTTVSGSASGHYSIFSGDASGSFSQLNERASSSQFTITGSIGKYATIAANASKWFDGSQVSRAYNAKNDMNVWDPNSNIGSWNSFFDDTGSLARRVSQLVLVSDYDLTVTSKASYSASDVSEIKTHATFGIWPFFSAKVDTSHTTTITHNENGTLSVRYVLNKGLIAIWGATIQSAPN